MDQKSKISLEQLKESLIKFSSEELSYILGRYCGPHNILMREKAYEYEAAKRLTQLVNRELASRAIDCMLTDSLLSDNE